MPNQYHSKYARAVNRMLLNGSYRIQLGLKTTDWERISKEGVPFALFRAQIPFVLDYDGMTIKADYENPLYLREALKRIRGKR